MSNRESKYGSHYGYGELSGHRKLREHGVVLKAKLKQANVRQEALAEEAGLCGSELSDLLYGEHPSYHKRVMLAAIRKHVFRSIDDVYEYLAAINDPRVDGTLRELLKNLAIGELGHAEKMEQWERHPLRVNVTSGTKQLRVKQPCWQLIVKSTEVDGQSRVYQIGIEPLPQRLADALYTDAQWLTLPIEVEAEES